MTFKMILNRVLVSAVACIVLAGCSDNRQDMAQLQAFLQKPRREVAATEYRVLPPDVISISSRYVPEVDGVIQRIRPDGKINLPLLGEIYVAGRTVGQIEQILKDRARTYYQLVDATVQVVRYRSRRFYVFGQVARPGPLPWTGTDTLLDVLAKVQPTYLAWPERITVVRGRQPTKGGYLPEDPNRPLEQQTGANEPKKLTVDLMKMVKSGDLSHNILLYPDDVVYVPPHPSAAVGIALRQVLYPVQPVLEAARIPPTMEDAAEPWDDEDNGD